METVEKRGVSRRFKGKNGEIIYQKSSHFHMARFGRLEEGQVTCYLWDIVKPLKTGPDTATARSAVLKKQLRRHACVEMRRYFARRKRRDMSLSTRVLCTFLCVGQLFEFVIGIDHMPGISMYPYPNGRNRIVYSRISGELWRGDVVVSERNGEVTVKQVAGLPGNRVEMNRAGNQVVVDGKRMGEESVTITEPVSGERREQAAPTQVAMNGQYLVLGDNRAESVDSRDSSIGTMPEEDVLEKVMLVVRNGR